MYGSGSYAQAPYASTISGIVSIIDSAVGNETSNLLVLLSQLDSASEISNSAINLSKSDSLVGDSSVTIFIPSVDSVQGADLATGGEVSTYIIFIGSDNANTSEVPLVHLLDKIDTAEGTDLTTALYGTLTNSDLATGLETTQSVPIVSDSAIGNSTVTDLLDITDLIVKLDGQEDIEIDLEGAYNLEELLNGRKDIEINLEGTYDLEELLDGQEDIEINLEGEIL